MRKLKNKLSREQIKAVSCQKRYLVLGFARSSHTRSSRERVPQLTSKRRNLMSGERKNFKLNNLKSSPIGETKAKSAWGRNFGGGAGFALKLPHDNVTTVFVDKRLQSGNPKKTKDLIGKKFEFARIITCEGNEWIVKSEPIGPDRSGLSIYTSGGKAMMSGTCDVKRDGELSVSVQTLHPSISNAKKTTAKVEGKGKSDGSWEVTGSVSVEF
jgi:hypothetical protein